MNDIPQRLGGPAESRVDRAIDRAVRQMMQVGTRPGFRGRVFARLDPEPRPSSSMFFRFAVAAGAMAVLVFAVLMVRHGGSTDDVERVPSVADGRAAQPQPAPGPLVTTRATPPARTRRDGHQSAHRVTREPIPMPRVTNVFGEPNAAAAAASVDADTVWAAPERQEEHPGAPPPLVIPAVEPPAPIVVAPLNRRGPGL
jgi:hypothetical protein